jgi:hypothetical protein
MKLNVLERLNLLNLLPQKEDISILRIVRDLQNSLGLTENEYKEFGVKVENGITSWNEKGIEEKEIPIGEMATMICSDALKKANKEKLLTQQYISLYDKFVKD